jgi:hypothetical protein
MTSPTQPDERSSKNDHRPALDRFIQRLVGAISRSPLLKIRPTKTGKLLDSVRFEQIRLGLSDEVLQGVTDGTKPVPIQLDLRALKERGGQDAVGDSPQEDNKRASDRLGLEHVGIYKILERMSRDAELVQRETGRHALWLGFPLLYAAAGDSDIPAPVFLWPIDVRIDLPRQGRVLVGRNETIAPQFNRAMSAWLKRQLEVQLDNLAAEELSQFDLDAVEDELHFIAGRFHPTPPMIDCGALLQATPSLKSLDPKGGPRFYNSAVIGYFRWQNEAILADLETLRSRKGCPGVAGEFLRGTEVPRAEVPVPREEDRFLVCEADFS